MAGSVLGTGDIAGYQTDHDSYPRGAYHLLIEIKRARFNIWHYSTTNLFHNQYHAFYLNKYVNITG